MPRLLLRRCFFLICLALLIGDGGFVVAQSTSANNGSTPEVLPQTCEVNLALSAGPDHLREGAGVYALGEGGYEQVQASTNGFTCIVNRDHPRVLKPTCFDVEGSATIVPKILKFGELLMQGHALRDIRSTIREGFEDGTFISPQRPGLAYMLSNYNRPYNAQNNTLGWFPPHVMFYAPDMVNADIGATREAVAKNWQQPFIAYQGPQGYMIVRMQEASTPQAGDLPTCPTWVKE